MRNFDTLYWEMVAKSIWRISIFLILIYLFFYMLTKDNTGDSRNQPEVTCEYDYIRQRVCY